MSVNHYKSPGSRVFDALNILLLTGLALIMVLPLLYVLAGSFATESEIATRPFFLWPEKFVTDTYAYIFGTDTFVRALITTICVTAVGTAVQLMLTLTMAYPLAKRYLPGRTLVLNLVIFTIVFGGGMIPTYLVVRDLGLLDSYWALILPLAINPFYLIIVKSFFQELPQALEEAARIDGCSEMGVFFRIVLPLSKPVIATFALFYAVGIWNDYMSPLLYIDDSSKWTLQVLVRQFTSADAENALAQLDSVFFPAEGLKFAVVVIATLPILFFYPFLQKHFAKGVLIGSVKE
ncbi:carbohydrate ABC transporter permease [Planomonospora sp. ID91781]|uniref:ABC transporter permease n=3 Tax=Planomonospora TaxID=1998 RepID=A0A171BZI6_9ACTN|nr:MULTISPECIES: carbohydrate ABC transporter permease [Planomonospora]MBG0824177.1 carbohydrate ABC transporter permease [Planomonospora sp. ID91781]GAT65848.1 ABC transporter permease [Planomonospora sphaerica]GGK78290.1 protein LplC [Planomonospora parontospora]GII10345.1 protein LplC [Planomonospora parontospora subsp. parontospora]